ncbi:hypothetical protein [Niveispirillum irakense]|uniref:hypothetical protein n=1 Tax=Niveispirillum irakense TaxID=34011 RepID=UPI0012B5DBBD|nr:hypothetical protein [Niveispirillum irakense]
MARLIKTVPGFLFGLLMLAVLLAGGRPGPVWAVAHANGPGMVTTLSGTVMPPSLTKAPAYRAQRADLAPCPKMQACPSGLMGLPLATTLLDPPAARTSRYMPPRNEPGRGITPTPDLPPPRRAA